MSGRVKLTEAQARFLGWMADPQRSGHFFADQRTETALKRKKLIETRHGSLYVTDAGRATLKAQEPNCGE